jgi:hypothetical protein
LSAQTANLENAGLLPLTFFIGRLVLGVINTPKPGRLKTFITGWFSVTAASDEVPSAFPNYPHDQSQALVIDVGLN